MPDRGHLKANRNDSGYKAKPLPFHHWLATHNERDNRSNGLLTDGRIRSSVGKRLSPSSEPQQRHRDVPRKILRVTELHGFHEEANTSLSAEW